MQKLRRRKCFGSNLFTTFISKISLFLLLLLLSKMVFCDSSVQIWQKAKKLISEGKAEEGIKLYDDLLVNNPKDAEIVMGAGCLRYFEGKNALERGDFTRAYELFTDAKKQFDTVVYLGDPVTKSRAYFNKGNCDLVLGSEFEKSKDFSLKNVDLGTLFKNAISSYRKSLELNPELLEAKKNLEYALYKLKKLINEEKEKNQEENKDKEKSNEEIISAFVNATTEIPGKTVEIDPNDSKILRMKDKPKNEQ